MNKREYKTVLDPERKRHKVIRSREAGHELVIRQRVIGEYFRQFTWRQVKWLKEITEQYMDYGVWPAVPILLLPSYYSDARDKEVALFVATLIPEDGDILTYISEMRAVMGEHPWIWFAERRFVSLSLGAVIRKRTAGVTNWKIATLMNRLWSDNPPETFCGVVHSMAVRKLGDSDTLYLSALQELYEGLELRYPSYRIRLLLMTLATTEGFGFGLWSVENSELRCPLSDDSRAFLETWFPNAKGYGSYDKCVHEFGFEEDYLFWYCYLGFRALERVEPDKCAYLTKRFKRWYIKDTPQDNWHWKVLLPDIHFE